MSSKSFAIFCLLICVMIFNSCRTFIWSQSAIDAYFSQSKYKPEQHQIEVNGRTINYAEIGNDSLPTVIFIHGSPGSWNGYAGFMRDTSLLSHVKMIAIDRIGFGHSEHGKGEKTLEKQVAYLKPIIQKYKRPNTKLILVGHSMGGPIVAKMAMDYPELVDHVIIVAGALCPELEPNQKWYRIPLSMPPFRFFASKTIKASNYELLHLKTELKAMKPLWINIHQPVTVIQGAKDQLVNPKNVDFAKKMIINSSKLNFVIVKNMHHDIPWAYPELINNAIIDALDNSNIHTHINN
jgi:pimeloyl-ACP methyl ester carboxylesterase